MQTSQTVLIIARLFRRRPTITFFCRTGWGGGGRHWLLDRTGEGPHIFCQKNSSSERNCKFFTGENKGMFIVCAALLASNTFWHIEHTGRVSHCLGLPRNVQIVSFSYRDSNNNTSPYWAVEYNEQSGLHITTQIRSFTPFCVQSGPVKVYLKPQFSVLSSGFSND